MTRVLVVDDSPTCRHLMVSLLEADPGITVVGEAGTGAEAVDRVTRLGPDIVVMDIHMPVLDGLEATRRIMEMRPTPILIVSSNDSRDDIERSLAATQAGALMAIAKPHDPGNPRFDDDSRLLLDMTRALADVKVVTRRNVHGRAGAASRPVLAGAAGRIRMVAVAASTGGPAALRRLFKALPARFDAPVVVVQHVARGFTSGLERWLGDGSPLPVRVAVDGERLVPGIVYLAPEDRHLAVTSAGRVVLADSPPVDGFRPSATVTFRSVAEAYGTSGAAVVMTGMGRDGVEGLHAVRCSGGLVLAQDRESCVVYGMAGEAVRAGVVHAVLPIESIAATLVDRVRRNGS